MLAWAGAGVGFVPAPPFYAVLVENSYILIAVFYFRCFMSNEPVSRAVCDANIERVLDRIDVYHAEVTRLDRVVHGATGRNGLVKDVQRNTDAISRATALKSIATGVLSSLVTAVVIYFIVPLG